MKDTELKVVVKGIGYMDSVHGGRVTTNDYPNIINKLATITYIGIILSRNYTGDYRAHNKYSYDIV